MKLDMEVQMNLQPGKVGALVRGASEEGLRDIIVAIAADAVKGSPYLTGHNRRSIQYEAKGLTASAFSTSGYGGFLETGTVRMPARPYFKPALDRNIGKLGEAIKARLP